MGSAICELKLSPLADLISCSIGTNQPKAWFAAFSFSVVAAKSVVFAREESRCGFSPSDAVEASLGLLCLQRRLSNSFAGLGAVHDLGHRILGPLPNTCLTVERIQMSLLSNSLVLATLVPSLFNLGSRQKVSFAQVRLFVKCTLCSHLAISSGNSFLDCLCACDLQK